MDTTQPIVSVIMPVYKAGEFVEEAIRSVLAQTVTDLELLVIPAAAQRAEYGRCQDPQQRS